MKTHNAVLGTLVVLTLSTVLISQGFAMGNGQGQGQGQGRGYGNMSQQEQARGTHSAGDVLANIPLQDLSLEEKNALLYSYAEETLARDMYQYFYELYGTQVFQNIANSEQQHQDAVKNLLERYSLDTPLGYGELEDEFQTLREKGAQSLKDALEVGIQIEILDIEDIVETIMMIDNDDIKIVMSKIGGALYNHLRGFVQALTQAGYETELLYSDHLTTKELASKGSLQYKMSDKIEALGGSIPETQAQVKNTQKNMSQGGKKKGRGENMKKKQELRETYSLRVEKYRSLVDTLDSDQKLRVQEKVGEMKDAIHQDASYTQAKKMNIIAFLEAFEGLFVK